MAPDLPPQRLPLGLPADCLEARPRKRPHLKHWLSSRLDNSDCRGWGPLPDATKARTFQEVFQKTKAAGKEATLSDEQRQAEILRISIEISRRMGK